MREISAGLFMSLDGVVDADSDWQYPYFDAELLDHIRAGTEHIDAVLIGRRSFEGYRDLRTGHPDSPFLPFLERVERHVVSSTLRDSAWAGTHVVTGEVTDYVEALKNAPGGRIGVVGSPSIVRLLLGAGLLDVLRLIVLPVVVGKGARLFPQDDPTARATLQLAESSPMLSGAVALTYRLSQG